MKRILFLLSFLLAAAAGYSQSSYYMRYDTVVIMRYGGNGELTILNAGRDSQKGGVLYNTGGGRTAFKKTVALNDSTLIIGGDTVVILGGVKGGSALDTTSLSDRIDSKLNISDTLLMLYPFLRKNDTASLSNRIDQRVKYSDTAAMLAVYLLKADTASLSNRIDERMKYSDTVTLSNRIDGKQPAGNYITGLNGDVAATGPGLANAVLAATSVIPGTYKLATVGVDQKGRTVLAANGVVEQINDSTFRINEDTITIRGTGGGADSTIFATVYGVDTAKANLRDEIAAITLQTVTDAGATTSNKMAYTTLPYFLISDSAKIPNKKYVDTRQEGYLGMIYNANSWSNLNDFTQTGGIGAAINSNKIDISGGNGTFVKTLDLNWYTMLERWKISARFKITSALAGTTYGIGVGIHSTNGYGSVNALGRIDLTNGGSGGQLFLNGHTDNSQLAASTSNLPIANSDTIVLTVERKVDSIIVYATNITQSNAKVRVGYKYDITASMAKQLPNTGKFSLFAFGGTQTIDSISITSGEIKNSTLLVIGDSKTQAYYADNFNSRYATQLDGVYKSTVLHAGGYDRTTEWVTYLPELKALSPKQVLLTNPSNDLRSGISSGTSQSQYNRIVDSLMSWGIDVFHALSFYETAQDNSAWNTYIISTYPANRIIDTWTPTKNCTGCISGDGIHLTKKGNDTVYTAIKDSYKVIMGSGSGSSSTATFSGTDNTIAMFSGGNLINSSVYQDNDRVYMSKGFESATTSPGFDLYKTNAATNEKGWNFYNDATNMYIATFNDARNAVYNAMKFNRTGNAVNYIAAPQPFVVGTSTDPGTYMQSVVTTTAPILRLRTSNATGGYIGFDNSSTTKGYIGYGSSLTTGASNNDITIRSQNDTIHFSNNIGTSMAKVAAGKLYVTAHAIGSNSDSSVIWDRSTNEYKVAKINGLTSLNGTTTHDFGTIANNSSATTTISVTGAADGDYVLVTKPVASGWSNGESYTAWVSGPDIVTVRQNNNSGGSVDFGSQTINVKVIKQ